jgi:hypothetical protein
MPQSVNVKVSDKRGKYPPMTFPVGGDPMKAGEKAIQRYIREQKIKTTYKPGNPGRFRFMAEFV